MKLLVRYIFILLLLLFVQCNTNEKPINEGEDSELHLTDYNKVENYLNSEIPNKILTNDIYIDDTNNVSRINIYVNYKFTHRYLEAILMEKVFYTIKENDLFEALKSEDEFFYVNIVYNYEGENKALITVHYKSDLSYFKEYPYYEVFSNYVIDNMTPSDLQAYDYALKVLFERTNDKRFETDFQSFLKQMSSHLEPSENDKFILTELIKWTKEREGVETPIHFKYFLNYVKNNIVFVN